MLIDDVTIHLEAGDGGKGAVAFNNVPMMLGPTGADGGTGGSIYFEGVTRLEALQQFRYKKSVEAKRGEDGKKQFRDGAAAPDVILKIPVGTVIENLETHETAEITEAGQRVLAVRGGQGGRGNFKFRSSRNTTPKESEPGKPGERADFHLTLKLIADIGIIGLPNAGKSSLLNALTGASSKVGNYPFTTLEPALGVWHGLILADIPGLIAGAASGKGLGDTFLRHIERTRVLFHLISAESGDIAADYRTVRAELEAYDPALGKKEALVFVSKADEASPEQLRGALAALNAAGIPAKPLSVLDEHGLDAVISALERIADGRGIDPAVHTRPS
ncbi:MAG TPA: GTPase ObgE [Candidatus Paceibacterota bacterium]|nr:GTPase ObgE [Candidatus Paceibacterota bacterium]